MRRLWLILLLGSSVGLWSQTPSQSAAGASKPQEHEPKSSSAPARSSSSSSSSPSSPGPNLAPPRSDTVNASALEDGESSSKETRIDLSPPADDAKAHPKSSEILTDEGSGASDASELHPWDPHRAAKDIEVGDFYFKRKNYSAAEDRYREALYYKDNDALATYRLAICLEKMERPEEARQEYQRYLEILPHGAEAENAKKAVERLGAAKAQK
jgi:tetratricopeptide (TPR) repeat protein